MTVSKSGIGYSVGTKGARVTKKAGGGVRTSVGGNGVYYTNDFSGGSSRRKTGKKKSGCLPWLIGILIVLGIVGALASCESDETDAVDQEPTSAVDQTEAEEPKQDEETPPAEQEEAAIEPVFLDPYGGEDQTAPEDEAAQTASAPVIVYYTETGSKYHRAGCRHLEDSKYETTLDEAIARGLEPCGNCY